MVNNRETGLDAARNASKKVLHKTTEAGRDLIGNKIADKIVKLKPMLFHQGKEEKYYMN